jgi:hypothetical protein
MRFAFWHFRHYLAYYLGSWEGGSVPNPNDLHRTKPGKGKHAKVSLFMREEK